MCQSAMINIQYIINIIAIIIQMYNYDICWHMHQCMFIRIWICHIQMIIMNYMNICIIALGKRELHSLITMAMANRSNPSAYIIKYKHTIYLYTRFTLVQNPEALLCCCWKLLLNLLKLSIANRFYVFYYVMRAIIIWSKSKPSLKWQIHP